MRPTFALGIASGLTLVLTCGCRSAGEASPAADLARVSADVVRRTGVSTSTHCDDAAVVATCRALLARPLTDESAVKVALLGNASVRESYERLGIARADLLQAGLVANPVFSASAKFFSAGPEVELGLAQSFVEIFFMPLRRRVAASNLCAAQAEVTRELVGLVYDVRRALVAVRGAREIARVRREALTTVTAARDLMNKLHEAGNVRDADFTVEEVNSARAQMNVEAADVEARDAREAMNVLLGACATQVAWTVEGPLEAPPALPSGADAEGRALAASLDLVEAKARIASALGSTALARRLGVLPHLELGVVGKRESANGAWGFGPQVSTALPIFDTGVAKVLSASAVARQRVARHEQLTVEVAAAARRLADRARTLRGREGYVRETYLPLRTRLLNETLQTFNAMQIGAFDVLDAKEGEADARREHIQTRTAAWTAALDLGELLAGKLNRERIDALHLPESAERPTPPKGH